ncbi:MAG: TIM barrel protein [Verrucomicrobiales bacterium]|nr:TIM barrel protein [Verrucomicrobiales bacterium]MCP5519807.1 TIM barrel protein [Verrucomicrobiales bacterium]
MNKPQTRRPGPSPAGFNRRQMIGRTATATLGALALQPARAAEGPAVVRGRIRQSIVHWPFEAFGEKWNGEQICRIAHELGCQSVELVATDVYPILKQHGLTCAICQIDMSPDAPFVKGWNNPDHWPRLTQATRAAIDAAAEHGFPNVICFTGFSARNPDDPASPHLSLEEGARNCVRGLKEMTRYAEQKQVTLCLEMLNTRDDTHPMKGHPGYQGNHTDYCIDIIEAVGSPRLKLLFDVYHVQVMDGDVIRRIHQLKDYIGHVHTAGCPGRNELNDRQEINYRPVMQALLDIGYTGFVGQEYIPTCCPLDGLRQAVSLCDV